MHESRLRRYRLFPALVTFVAFVWGLGQVQIGRAQSSAAESGKLQYNRDIRPILADHCFSCHGPDSASRKADLRLDKGDAAVAAGAIVPAMRAQVS